MGSKISGFDFSPFKQAMLNKGIPQAEVDACFSDLMVILHDAEDNNRPHAMTEGADRAFHYVVSDTVGHLRLSAAIHGAGMVMVHNPHAYGTPEFEAAWENTRAAFAKHDIELASDYRADRDTFRSAAACIREARSVNEIQSSVGFRSAAACIREARGIADIQQAA